MKCMEFIDAVYNKEEFKGLKLSGSSLGEKEFSACVFSKCTFSECDFSNSVFIDCEFGRYPKH